MDEKITPLPEPTSLAQKAVPNHPPWQKLAVSVSFRQDDPTILTVLIDRTASRTRILNDLKRVLPQFKVPYRELDPRLAEVVRLKATNGLTLKEASTSVYGSRILPRSVRYWRNKWGIR
jgi:hypothetical protein